MQTFKKSVLIRIRINDIRLPHHNETSNKTYVTDDAIARKNEIKINAIREKGLAEAEAMKEYGDVAIVEMFIKALTDFARAIAEPLTAIQNVQIMDFGGDGSGVQSVAGNTVGVMTMVQKALKDTTGIDMKHLMETNASYGRNYLQETPNEETKPSSETGGKQDDQEVIPSHDIVDSEEHYAVHDKVK